MTGPDDMSITVSVVEDDQRVRQSLAGILCRAPGISCVGQYASAEEALTEIPRHLSKVVLMDLNLPGMNGVECVRKLSELLPGAHIIILTVYEDTDSIFDSLAAGACGYLLKPVRGVELLAAVKDVYAGGAPMSSNIARKVVQAFKQAPAPLRETEALSPREQQVLEFLAKGYLYKEIADLLHISYGTVHTHIERIYEKLHVCSRAQAVAKYLRA